MHFNEKTINNAEFFDKLKDRINLDLRVACPGIIKSVDYEKQTCTVQLAIRERIIEKGEFKWEDIPELLDVPFFILSSKEYCITFPIKENDECLVVFSDSCIDAWWQSGNVQNQIERRRHDLSDGFALVGFRSQVKLIENYDTAAVQIRTKNKKTFVELRDENVKVKTESGNVKVETNSGNIDFESTNGDIKLKGENIVVEATQNLVVTGNYATVNLPTTDWSGNVGGMGSITVANDIYLNEYSIWEHNHFAPNGYTQPMYIRP